MPLTRDQILNSTVAPTLETVEVPEWGGEVLIGVLTGRQRDRFERAATDAKDKGQIRAMLAAFAIRGEDNKPIFTEHDINALGEKSSIALDRVFRAAFKLNRMGETDLADDAKNSETTP